MVRKRKSPAGGSGGDILLDGQDLVLQSRSTLSSTREVGEAAEKFMKVAAEQGCGEEAITDIGIALREALANAITHGNDSDPKKRVQLLFYRDLEGGVLLAVQDEGKGFDPDAIPDPTGAERIHMPHGRGIFLMRELMDHVEHRKGGREVLLYKRCCAEHEVGTPSGRAQRKNDR